MKIKPKPLNPAPTQVYHDPNHVKYYLYNPPINLCIKEILAIEILRDSINPLDIELLHIFLGLVHEYRPNSEIVESKNWIMDFFLSPYLIAVQLRKAEDQKLDNAFPVLLNYFFKLMVKSFQDTLHNNNSINNLLNLSNETILKFLNLKNELNQNFFHLLALAYENIKGLRTMQSITSNYTCFLGKLKEKVKKIATCELAIIINSKDAYNKMPQDYFKLFATYPAQLYYQEIIEASCSTQEIPLDELMGNVSYSELKSN